MKNSVVFKRSSEMESFELPVGAHSLRVSLDATRVAYLVSEKHSVRVEVNGRKQGVYESVDNLVFGGHSLAYAAKSKQGWRVVFAGRESESWDLIGPEGPVISSDDQHVAYTAWKDSRWYTVLDEQVIDGPFDAFVPGGVIFSPNSSRLAYAVCVDGEEHLVVDGIQREGHKAVVPRSWVFSADSCHVAYVMVTADGSASKPMARVLVDRDQCQPWIYEGPNSPNRVDNEVVFTPDGRHLAYSVVQDGAVGVVVDEVGEPMRRIPQPAGRERLAGGWKADLKAIRGLDADKALWRSQKLVFSPDSRHLAYAVFDGSMDRIIIDGVERSRHPRLLDWPILFSPDSRHVAYAVEKAFRQFLLVDGIPLQKCDQLALVEWSFGPDSSHVAYCFQQGSQWFAAIDDRHPLLLPGEPLTGSPLVWRSPTEFYFLLMVGRRIQRMAHTV